MKLLQKLKSLILRDAKDVPSNTQTDAAINFNDYIEVKIERFGNDAEEINPFYRIYYKTSPNKDWVLLTRNFIFISSNGGWLSPDSEHPMLLSQQEALTFAKSLTRESLKKYMEDKDKEWRSFLSARKEYIENIKKRNPKIIKVK